MTNDVHRLSLRTTTLAGSLIAAHDAVGARVGRFLEVLTEHPILRPGRGGVKRDGPRTGSMSLRDLDDPVSTTISSQ
jgi:hypothetical protein